MPATQPWLLPGAKRCHQSPCTPCSGSALHAAFSLVDTSCIPYRQEGDLYFDLPGSCGRLAAKLRPRMQLENSNALCQCVVVQAVVQQHSHGSYQGLNDVHLGPYQEESEATSRCWALASCPALMPNLPGSCGRLAAKLRPRMQLLMQLENSNCKTMN